MSLLINLIGPKVWIISAYSTLKACLMLPFYIPLSRKRVPNENYDNECGCDKRLTERPLLDHRYTKQVDGIGNASRDLIKLIKVLLNPCALLRKIFFCIAGEVQIHRSGEVLQEVVC